ncbi:tuberin isoform X1 [Frankliniella occidentalis]|uniref:Tuberin isoform X1 n=1 Tax=Frankliniella occidentalis TaxID=133901 RepID=A0A6J1SBE4_FRAOC|nr:tuberin isoform X1 [Frankliniella occidentalis]XP_026278514.1 tuberin isoform X1 [Frankliniella occidentalis]
MSAKDKDSKPLRRLKQFFGIHNKGGIATLRGRQDFVLAPEIEAQLRKENPINQRNRVLRDLCEDVKENSVDYGDMEKLRLLIEDLFCPEIPKDYRNQAYSFYRCLIAGQYDRLHKMRVHIFDIIKDNDIQEDVALRFDLLNALTDNGKVIEHLEEKMGHFLLSWMPAVVTASKTEEFLTLLVNVVKYNAAYMDDDVIMQLVQNVCYLCCWVKDKNVVMGCLQVLDTVVRYSNLPSESLQDFVSALCRTVNIEAYCQESWKIMRNLLGTHMGHAALYTMCRILQKKDYQQDTGLMRGAVFYINMGLWGSKRVPSLVCTETSVLPSLLQAASAGQAVVVYEVMLSCQRLVNKYGVELQDPAWDLLLSILEAVVKHIEVSPHPTAQQSTALVGKHLHETLCHIEKLYELGQFQGSARRVFELIERCSPHRPEASVMRLVTYLASSVEPTRHQWLAKLHALLEKFFRLETRTKIRVKVLGVLEKVIQTNRAAYEDELIEQAVVPFLDHIDQDQDVAVRNAAAGLLIELCLSCDSKRCLELLDILEKLLNRPFEVPNIVDSELIDTCTVAKGVVHIFVAKMYQLPSAHAIRAYKILVNHLEMHYRNQSVLDNHRSIRQPIFECFLCIRANYSYQLGYPGGMKAELGKPLVFSPYLGVDHKHGERTGGASSPPPVSPAPSAHVPCVFTALSLTHACKAVISGLRHERDWKVLELILSQVPEVMKNKALILSRHANDIDQMAASLCSIVSFMLNDRSLPDTLRNTPSPKESRFSRSDFHSYLFPVLASLASYHNNLDPPHQRRLICSLELGLQSKCAAKVISALTTCTLEMKDAMYKLLPEVLLNLSKISDTVNIALPILSFLSTLTRLPKVFASFVGDQYMSVLAISLPYSNPFKYNHFIVSLAHHVIAVWFLKCRLPFRKDFVQFITKGLKANVSQMSLEDGQVLRQDPLKVDLLNEDSSSRKRSSSLTEQGSRRRTIGSRLDARIVDLKPPDEALTLFHMELTETCIDLMARYTFSTCAAMPKRLPAVRSLLSGGQSMTWLLGNRLITVTTSGCTQKVKRDGLCDKCLLSCRLEQADATTESSTCDLSGSNLPQERISRTEQQNKATLQRSNSVDVSATVSRDDKSSGSAAASSTSGGSSRNLPLLVQVPQGTNSLAPSVSSPTEEHRRLSGSLEMMDSESSKLDQLIQGVDRNDLQDKSLCCCWCNGWAEIYVRRPTGDMSWVMRIQNQNSVLDLSDVPTLFLPSLMKKEQSVPTVLSLSERNSIDDATLPISEENAVSSLVSLQPAPPSAQSEPVNIPASPIRRSPSRQSSRDSLDEEEEEECDPDAELDDGSGRARNPVRRSNSSPEMSAGWRNPFLSSAAADREKMDKMTKPSYSKDLRANCEAIPEEIAGLGTTPPSSSPGSETLQKALRQNTSAIISSNVAESQATTVTSAASSNLSIGSTSTTSPLVTSSLKVGYPLQASSTTNVYPTSPLLLPSTLTTKPPLSPTQTRHMNELEQKAKVSGTASPNVMGKDRVLASGRLSSGSASSSVGGSTSSLDSKANTEQLHLQLDRRVQQTSAPASPTTSHAHNLSASAERINRDDGSLRQDPAALPPLAFKRDRGHTISVMSPVRKPRLDLDAKRNKSISSSPRSKETQQRSSVNPNLIFLQLYHSSYFGSSTEKPLLANSDGLKLAIKNFDRMPPYETHKVGVLYVGLGQANNEQEILRNTTGSLRYTEFLQRLGSLISLEDPDPHLFLGGLEKNKDGKFAYFWQDDVTQVTFHVATLMPTRDSDPSCTDKKRHIGNNYVTIVFNESGEDFHIQTIKGQFSYACVEIQPLDHGSNQVTLRTRDMLKDLGLTSEPRVVSDLNLGILARQLALHANLASKSWSGKERGNIYASNWLERLRTIKRMRAKIIQESKSEDNSGPVSTSSGHKPPIDVNSRINRNLPDDFTEYT